MSNKETSMYTIGRHEVATLSSSALAVTDTLATKSVKLRCGIMLLLALVNLASINCIHKVAVGLTISQ